MVVGVGHFSRDPSVNLLEELSVPRLTTLCIQELEAVLCIRYMHCTDAATPYLIGEISQSRSRSCAQTPTRRIT